ncbi:MAG: ribosome small subunit-dependent GTPase A, partial [Bacteroidales bacterium]|nr:ribosome small subunit-dependent GTPase A [Bacteroidales bacterium]
MRLTDLGLTQELSEFIREQISPDFTVGRVTQEHRERYVVSDGEKDYDAEITGNIRFAAASREDFPAVGDWVTMTLYGTNQAVINKILPRKSLLARQAVGKTG